MNQEKFEYFAPGSVEEAVDLLLEKGEGAYILAGGTDLLIKMRHGLVKPTAVIGLRNIKGLNKISFDRKKGLTIGAAALLADVASHPDILKTYPAVAYAAGETANTQIRNMGTVAGNLCNAAPSAENAPPLIAMGAEVVLSGSKGERLIPLEDFFLGPGSTAMERGEIMTAISVPVPPSGSGACYKHISPRGKVDISAASAGVMLTMDQGTCLEARIALGAVAPVPMRALKAEGLVKGKKLTDALIRDAGVQASKECKPISDLRASKDYRKRMIRVLTSRAIAEARERAERGI